MTYALHSHFTNLCQSLTKRGRSYPTKRSRLFFVVDLLCAGTKGEFKWKPSLYIESVHFECNESCLYVKHLFSMTCSMYVCILVLVSRKSLWYGPRLS